MSTMKSFITTLDLVMQDKVEPETVVEEDEIEETLTINEDGEIVDENLLTDKLKAAESAVLSATDIIMGGKYDESVEQEWKAFDDLYDKALLISDPDERKKLYVEMDKIMLEEAPMVPLYYDEIINFTQKNVQGLKVTPSKLLILKETKIIN